MPWLLFCIQRWVSKEQQVNLLKYSKKVENSGYFYYYNELSTTFFRLKLGFPKVASIHISEKSLFICTNTWKQFSRSRRRPWARLQPSPLGSWRLDFLVFQRQSTATKHKNYYSSRWCWKMMQLKMFLPVRSSQRLRSEEWTSSSRCDASPYLWAWTAWKCCPNSPPSTRSFAKISRHSPSGFRRGTWVLEVEFLSLKKEMQNL